MIRRSLLPAFIILGAALIVKLNAKPLDNHDSAQGDSVESAASDQDVLLAIERICGDDFCEDLEMRDVTGDFSANPDLQCATEKLSAIYCLSHAFVKSHTCYHVHNDWRSEVKPAALSNSAPNAKVASHPEGQ